MTAGELSLRYVLNDESDVSLRPRFEFTPDTGPGNDARFIATNLRSVDRLDIHWSTRDLMKVDPVKAYLAKIGASGRAVNSPAQKKAARVNGKRGGRPKGSKDSKPRTRRPS